MGLPPQKSPARRRRRWIRRGLLIAAGAVAAGIAVPFVFTGSVVRYWLARSALHNLPLRFESARLSPFGRLTLTKVVLEDSREQRGRHLLTADKAEISFRWADLASGRLEQVALENMDVTVRPGKETPVTLLRLVDLGAPDAGAPATQAVPANPAVRGSAAPASANAKSPWVDQVLLSGVVRFEGYGTALAAYGVTENAPIPLHLMVTSSGGQSNWNGTLSVVAGETTGDHPRMSARLTAAGSPDSTTLKLESLSMEGVSANFSDTIAANWTAMPEWARRALALRVDSLNLGGTATFGKDSSIALTAELRDVSARGTAAGSALAVQHLAAGMHMEGKLSAAPFDDLAFSHMRASWDGVQAGSWKFGKGVADLGVEGTEIELNDLQTTTADAEVVATGAVDTATGIVSRGRVWLNNFSAPQLVARLPEDARHGLPWGLNGTLSARIFLTESDAFHLAAHVELVCPERLLALAVSQVGGTGQPWASVSNLDISGTVSYALQPGARPEVSRGRVTADQWVLVAPQANGDPDVGLAVSKIKSDFTITADKAVLNDFYADLPGNGRITAEAEYGFADRALTRSKLNLNGVDVALANPWLPAGWSLSGQLDTGLQLSLSPRTGECQVSMNLAPQTTLKGPDGTLSLTGAPVPVAGLHGVLERSQGVWNFDTGEITSIGALSADAGMIKSLRKILAPAPGGALEGALDTISASGGMVSFDRIALTGSVASSGAFAGNLVLGGLDVGQGADKPLVQNLTFKAGISMPAPLDLQQLRMAKSQLLAEKVTLGQSTLTEFGGTLSVDGGKLMVSGLGFNTAEGAVEGDATISLPAQLDVLHLNFSGISQQVLTRMLYPDKFTAEGPVSGKLTLVRGASGIRGSIDMVPDKEGRLKISRDTSGQVFAPAAQAAAAAQGALLPDNFEQIVIGQLANYPYVEGHATLKDTSRGVDLTLNYTRPPLQPGEPGYGVPITVAGQLVKANLEFQLKGTTIGVNYSIAELLGRALGFQHTLLGQSVAPASASAVAPATQP